MIALFMPDAWELASVPIQHDDWLSGVLSRSEVEV